MNQWSDMEGYQHSFVDPYGYTFNLLDGDVIFIMATKIQKWTSILLLHINMKREDSGMPQSLFL